VVAFVSGGAFDITGVTLGAAVVGLGVLVLPRRRVRAKRELHEQLQALRDGLGRDLDRQLQVELERAEASLAGAIAPYVRFVESETERLASLSEELASVASEAAEVRREALELEPEQV